MLYQYTKADMDQHCSENDDGDLQPDIHCKEMITRMKLIRETDSIPSPKTEKVHLCALAAAVSALASPAASIPKDESSVDRCMM